jgi:Transposase, Mutator family
MFRMHPGARAEPVLAAWGITTDGKPAFVALAAGGSESADAWGGFLDELTGRGLRPPLLVISDGAAGLINAAESALARSLRQKCLIHRARNVLAKVPAAAHDEIRGAYWAIFDTDALTTAGAEPGHKLVTVVQARIDAFAQTYGKRYPAAVKCLLTDREQLTSYLRFPIEHHKRIRHSNFIERTFGETRRRVKVIGRLPRRDQLPQPRLGCPGPRQPRMARREHHQHRAAPAARPAPSAPRPANPAPPDQPASRRTPRHCQRRRLTSQAKEPGPHHFSSMQQPSTELPTSSSSARQPNLSHQKPVETAVARPGAPSSWSVPS